MGDIKYRAYKVIAFLLLKLRRNDLFLKWTSVKHGKNCRIIKLKLSTFGSEPYLVSLGDNVTISNEVQFLTHDGGIHVFRQDLGPVDRLEPIKLGNNIFIGYGSIILPGTTIGNNTVIGAGSVVRGQIDGEAVYAGVPAKRIKPLEQYFSDVQGNMIQTYGAHFFKKKKFVKDR